MPAIRPPQAGEQVAPIYAQPQQQVVAKNPGLAAFLSFIWPGGGQIYNGQIGLGIGLMVLQVVNAILTFILIGFLTGFATWVYGMVQAHQKASSFNAQHGIIS